MGYSANVTLRLEALGKTYKLGKIGPGEVFASEPVCLPPCNADVVSVIDGDESRWMVWLPDGATPDEPRIRTFDVI